MTGRSAALVERGGSGGSVRGAPSATCDWLFGGWSIDFFRLLGTDPASTRHVLPPMHRKKCCRQVRTWVFETIPGETFSAVLDCEEFAVYVFATTSVLNIATTIGEKYSLSTVLDRRASKNDTQDSLTPSPSPRRPSGPSFLSANAALYQNRGPGPPEWHHFVPGRAGMWRGGVQLWGAGQPEKVRVASSHHFLLSLHFLCSRHFLRSLQFLRSLHFSALVIFSVLLV